MLSKRNLSLKNIMGLILSLVIVWDFFLNDRILLTKFSIKVTKITSDISAQLSENLANVLKVNC